MRLIYLLTINALMINALVLTACASTDDDGDGDGTGDDDGACLAEASYGAVASATMRSAFSFGPTTIEAADEVYLLVDLNSDQRPDALLLELYQVNGGVFADGIMPGTYEIAGAELQYSDCSVCPRIFTDLDRTVTPAAPTDEGYLATGGTVQLDSISPNLSGSLSGVTFEHVDVDATTFVSSPHPDGCISAIDSLEFEVENVFTQETESGVSAAFRPAVTRASGAAPTR
ncbi:MAG: hypothetical protein AAGC55_03650 [Myxococcota bacterium]